MKHTSVLPLTVCLAVTGCMADGEPRVPDEPTWAGHVAPILYDNCAPCHRPGGPGPFPLLTYEDARDHAALIVGMTGQRRMPPWLPSPGDYAFANERGLTAGEIETLARWADQGAPSGNLADVPAAPVWEGGWALGEPDLVLEMTDEYVLAATGPDVFRNFVIPVTLDRTRYVRAIEMQPGAPGAVHHAVMAVDASSASREEDERDPEPGFSGMFTRAGARPPGGFFIGWTPGLIPRPNPQGLAWPLSPGTDFVIMMHLRPNGEESRVRARVGFHFADTPPTRMPTLLRLGGQTLDIPPGDTAYVVTDSLTVPVDVEVLGLYPHAHYLGKTMDVRAELPDGTVQQMIRIDDWDFNWQDTYTLASPARLPAGTRIRLRYTFDNSATNPRNPNSPPKRVVYGPESGDEMAELWVQALPVDPSQLGILEQSMARKSVADRVAGWRHLIRMDSADASAHSSLATYMASTGDTAGAIEHYRKAVAAEPGFTGAHYNLANLLDATGDAGGAVQQYREALRTRPDHAGAHNNLGRLLASMGRRDEAITHFRRVVELDPDSAGGHFNLAIALAAAGRPDEALEQLRNGEQLEPDALQERLAMAWLLATHPDGKSRRPAEAIAIAESAGSLIGGPHPLVLDVLAAAQAAGGAYGYAATLADQAVRLATNAGQAELAARIQARLDLYRQNRAYTEPIR